MIPSPAKRRRGKLLKTFSRQKKDARVEKKKRGMEGTPKAH